MEDVEKAKENENENVEKKEDKIEKIKNLILENQKLKKDYNDLNNRYKIDEEKYFNSLEKNGQNQEVNKVYSKEEVNNLVDKIQKKQMSNLEYWRNVFKLREEFNGVYGKDIFNPSGDPKKHEKQQKAIETLQKIVNDSKTNEDFLILFNNNVFDSKPNAKLNFAKDPILKK